MDLYTTRTNLEISKNVKENKSSWKVILCDDDEEIHIITKMVLKDYSFMNKPIYFISAYSAEEAKKIIVENPDTAVIFLDVIMETDTAGLDLVHFIRKEIKNNILQIILRTGEPGQVPEHNVVEEYEINDYKTKQELTSQKLHTAITSALRAFRLADSYRILNTQLQKELSERKKIEEKMKISLREKEILLKEIHHRVKNNMQIISSLLSLQSRYIRDPKDLELFMDSENRVRSMALVHEKLYQSKNLTRIDFESYIRELIAHLSHFYNINLNEIKINVDVKNIYLNIEEAIPCAQIINELISNSMKYAFQGKNSGQIDVLFYKNDIEKYVLVIKDNGIGLPDNFNLENSKSLGLQLVTALNGQLKGKIDLDKTNGCSFTITF